MSFCKNVICDYVNHRDFCWNVLFINSLNVIFNDMILLKIESFTGR